jgi:hypothetical protein
MAVGYSFLEKSKYMSLIQLIFRKVYNRALLPFLRTNQIKQLPQFISRLVEVRRDENEFREILRVVRQEPRSIIPYKFIERYKRMPIKVFNDSEKCLPYTLVNQHKIYFPLMFDHEEIRWRVRQGLWEQADESPHRYFHQKDTPFEGRYAVLAGASDCIFATRILPHFEKVFLFEPDKRWLRSMEETVSDHGNKVEIIPKWVGDKIDTNHITLDKYFEGNHDKVDYIQADIEGEEMKMLWGTQKLIDASPRLKISICCYHNAHDEAEIGDFLRARGFVVRPSQGYMLLFMQYPLRYPYLRRGVLYASKGGLEI